MAHGTFALSLRCTGLSFSPGRAGTAAFRFDVHVVWQRTERAVRLPVELIQRHEGFRGFASGPKRYANDINGLAPRIAGVSMRFGLALWAYKSSASNNGSNWPARPRDDGDSRARAEYIMIGDALPGYLITNERGKPSSYVPGPISGERAILSKSRTARCGATLAMLGSWCCFTFEPGGGLARDEVSRSVGGGGTLPAPPRVCCTSRTSTCCGSLNFRGGGGGGNTEGQASICSMSFFKSLESGTTMDDGV